MRVPVVFGGEMPEGINGQIYRIRSIDHVHTLFDGGQVSIRIIRSRQRIQSLERNSQVIASIIDEL
jgi:hypothetical protein